MYPCMNLLFVGASDALGADWKPTYLCGLSLDGAYGDTVVIDGYSVRYDYLHEDVCSILYSREQLHALLQESYRYSVHKIRALGMSAVDCKQDLNVHFVQLQTETLNDDRRFGSWRNVNGTWLFTIHGLYDPTVETYRESVISFISLPEGSDHLIVHEMAHYWYDRFCLYDSSELKTETFAKAVEQDYTLGLLQR